jgi:D-arabinose 1-dehydrogenase-like Zn-dependent alcohol dehydrogenase
MRAMRAVQVTRARAPFELVERPIPEPGPRHVRIRVEACGVCHSDAFVRERSFPGVRLPRVPGHEVAGVVDALGEGVTAWRVGDRVGVGWHGGHCGTCTPCRRGDFVSCKKEQITGISFDGGYADYLVVPEVAPARIPDGLESADAGPLLCAGVTTYNALRHSGARPGDTVAVQGLGGLGHLGVQFAQRMGFRTVALSRGPDKAELAAQLGAHHYVDTAAQDPAAALQKLGGADVILATAPSAAAIGSTFGGLTPRGTLMVVGASPDTLAIPAFSLLSGKSVRGWPSGSAADSEDTMRFAALTGIRPMIEKFPLDQAEEAYARMIGNHARFRAVLLT